MRKERERRKLRFLLLLNVFLVLAVAAIWRCGKAEPLREYAQMQDAAARFEAAAAEIRAERLVRDLPLSADDTLGIGFIGADTSPITTTLGQLAAKRTAQTPDMAALCVRLLTEAGVEPGGRIGACMSGSFPGLNTALLCACDAMDVELVYTVSVGSSTYGANLPEFTAPEMLVHLYEKGLVKTAPRSISAGGEEDSGANMIGFRLGEEAVIEETLARVRALGVEYVSHPQIADNVAYHAALYGEIDCFVNVGGTVVGSGANYVVLGLGQGVIKDWDIRYEEKSGLLEYYLSKGVPAVQLLNIKQLCLEYGLAFDPTQLPPVGESAVYFGRSYPEAALLAVAAAVLAALFGYACKEKRKQHSERSAMFRINDTRNNNPNGTSRKEEL